MPYKKIYADWLNSDQISDLEKNKLKKYTDKEIKKEFWPNRFKFGTAGIREIVGLGPNKLNKFTCRAIAIAYSKFLKSKSKNPRVIIFFDNRKNSKDFCLEVASTLRSEGVKVYLSPNLSPAPTPILSYLIIRLKMDGGANITASHNPTEYNGIKIYNETGSQVSGEDENQIISHLPNPEEIINLKEKNKENFEEIDKELIDEYLKNIIKNLPTISGKIKGFGFLFSSHHGTTTGIMKKLARELGFTNFEEFEEECQITWKLNLGETTNPEEPESFNNIIKKAEELGINYVGATDPDGDRCAFAEKQKDGNWYFFNGNETGILSSYLKNKLCPKPKSYIATTYVTNDFIKKIFPNIPIHLTSTGFKNISKTINREEKLGNNLLIAFEESIGSLLIPSHREKDGLQQISWILEMISHVKSNYNITLKEYLHQIFKEYGYWKGYTYSLSLPKSRLEDIQKIQIEGVKTLWHKELGIYEWKIENEGWIKFRYSGTEPKLKTYYNLLGKSFEEIEMIEKKYKKIIKTLLFDKIKDAI